MKRRTLYVIGGIVFLLANIFLFAGSSVFVFSHVVSESMMPTVLKGDYVVSCQFIPGWRLAHTDRDTVSVNGFSRCRLSGEMIWLCSISLL